jgi:hypothetical protein
MYGIDFGVTPPGTIRKMNQDNNVCSTLTQMNLDTFMQAMAMIMFKNVFMYDMLGIRA